MSYRKLRIASSVFWGLAAVLLIVLWLRSYWWTEVISRSSQTASDATLISMFSGSGTLVFSTRTRPIAERSLTAPHDWQYYGQVRSQFAVERWFFWRLRSKEFIVQCPIWPLVIFTGTLATAPWLPCWSNRFSLRTLLIATTLIAVVLGLAMWAAKS